MRLERKLQPTDTATPLEDSPRVVFIIIINEVNMKVNEVIVKLDKVSLITLVLVSFDVREVDSVEVNGKGVKFRMKSGSLVNVRMV